MRISYFKSASCIAMAAFAGASAVAQNRDAVEPGGKSEAAEEAPASTIIVTGTKQNLSLQEVEVSAEVFTEERINREALFSLDDLLARTPNVSGGTLTSSLSIRGISRNGVGTAGQGVTSNVYVDGAPLATQALSFGFESLFDVEQVEVLRGPQSTVQGRNALAGAIVVNTKDPTYDWEVGGRVRVAERDTQQFAGVVSGPIVADQVAFRAVVDYQTTDGFVDFAAGDGGDFDFAQSLLLRGKLLIEPEALAGLRAELIVDYSENDTGAASAFVQSTAPITVPEGQAFDFDGNLTLGPPQTQQSETLRFVADIAYDLDENFTLRTIGTFEDTQRERFLGDVANPANFPTNAINDDATETYSAELRLEYEDDRWSGFVGAYYFEDEQDFLNAFFVLFQNQLFFPITPADTILSGDLTTNSDTQNYAFYGQARFEPNDKWTFDASFRYDREEFNTTGTVVGTPVFDPASCLATVPGGLVGSALDAVDVPCAVLLPPATNAPNQSATFDAFLPRASITYNINPDLSVFVAAQRGYRAGGTFLTQNAAGIEVGTFDPEFLNNYEVGFRSIWLDGDFVFNGNVFYSDLKDQQVIIPGPSGSFLDSRTVNAGQSSIYGLELSADWQVSRAFSLFGSLGLLDTEFEDFPFATPGSPFENLAGNELPEAPNVSFTLGASFKDDSGLFADASVNYRGPSEAGLENLGTAEIASGFVDQGLAPGLAEGFTERLDERAVVNTRIGYAADRFTVYAYATNLFDDRSRVFANFASVNTDGGAINFFDTPSATLIPPRTFGVGVDFNF